VLLIFFLKILPTPVSVARGPAVGLEDWFVAFLSVATSMCAQ
jgi:uncharacterized protein (DUF2062 family)